MIGSVIYQIFPDRFFNGIKENDPASTKKWGTNVNKDCFMGGDIEGIIKKLDYIKKLGIDVIYLNPIFESPSNHKYDTSDYYKIDKSFGNIDDFENLVRKCHENNIKIIIDGVFNHTSTNFFAFQDILKHQEKSKYIDWYDILNFPVEIKTNPPYKACGGASFLPKLNTGNLEVQNYILSVIKYWEDKKIDGIRLDVPFEINPSLLKRIRKETDLYILGEIWGYDRDEIPAHFDGITNYVLRDLIKKAVVNQNITANMFIEEWNILQKAYGENINYFANLAGSHDTERILTLCGENIKKEKLFYTLLFLMPGIPLIYYGDEIGLKGENDPFCRGCMEWNVNKWNMDIYNHIKKLINLRHKFEALRIGKVKLSKIDDRVLRIIRYTDNDKIEAIINFGFQSETIKDRIIEPLGFEIL